MTRINLTSLFIWPALSNRLEQKAIIEEISGHYSPDQIEELLQHVSKRKHGFLFVNLKADPSEMFQDSLVQKLCITKKYGHALGDAAQQPGPAARTDADGNSTELLMPGTWSFYLNRTIGTKSWFMDTSDAPFSTDLADENNSLVLDPVYAVLEVEIGGKVYWDLDNNSVPSFGEGLPEMNVTVVGSNNTDVSTTVVTDEEGVWRVFVPIRDVYNVTVAKEGFETVYYATANQSGYTVHDSPDSTDIEVTAGLVDAEGTVLSLIHI